MDHGPPDSKRPRLYSHAGVSLLHPTPPPAASQLPHHSAPPPGQYHPAHPYSRPSEHHPHPPPLGYPHQHPPAHIIHPPPPHPPPAPTHIDDRRHHEPDRYPPMQEHRQPPPSPAHTQYPYPLRESMVKPEVVDEALPQLRRPHSTGTAPEAMPGTPHPSLPPQPPPHEDRRHMSFDGGPPQPHYRQPSYPAPPQTPISHSTSYDYGPSYGPPQHEMSYAIPITAAAKRKAQRASQACDSCRQLKAKCDETKPCKSCKEKKLECKYRDPAPKAQDKVAADILDAITNFQAYFEKRMSKIERTLGKHGTRLGLPSDGILEDDDAHRPTSGATLGHAADETFSYSPENVTNSTEMEVEPQSVETDADAHQFAASQQARSTLRDLAKDEEMEDEPPGPPVAPGQPAIPLYHTTLASLLLKWKPIRQVVQHHLDREGIKYVDEFPIQQEERRGLLRLFGRGEGQGNGLVEREGSVDQGRWEAYDDYSDTGAPSPADCWGTIGGLTPPVAGDSKGAVNVPTLDFTEHLVWTYVKSYQDNIQNMHPLIIPKELNAMVHLFLENVRRTTAKRSNKYGEAGNVARFADMRDQTSSDIGQKRKRSPGVGPSATPPGVTPIPSKPAKPVFERSIQNALVLLVLALGKICLCKEKIPEVVPVNDPSQGSPVIRNGHPLSPMQGSPPSYAPMPLSSTLPSPKDLAGSRRGSFQSGTTSLPRIISVSKRNLDVIPGLDYFATATDILGGQLGGATLKHVYANILAGLYHGQLGRVLESYAYIRQAGYALQTKMRPSLDRLNKLHLRTPFHGTTVQTLRDNQLVYAFWSCLQLESDIIAELPLPQSGILAFEEMIPYPNATLAGDMGFDPRVLASFTAQLYLRKALNQVHQMLYDPTKPQQDPLPEVLRPDSDFNIVDYIESALNMDFVPQQFKFDKDDPPAGDILSARLRAKYYGALVITFRPFIKQIVHFNLRATLNSRNPISAESRSDVTVPVINPEATIAKDIDPLLIEYARKGIEALIQSTKAFHGLGHQRFIITNVFGTAHAQWGNLLVLSAVYKDPVLNKFVDEATLRELFAKTISFFKIVAHSSSALSVDMRILQGLDRELWHARPADIPGPNSSFGSTTTTDTLTLAPIASSASAPPVMYPLSRPGDGILPPPPPMPQPSWKMAS